MLEAGEYSDALRALGRFLEQVNARNLQIAHLGGSVGVSWERASTEREIREFRSSEVDALRVTARLFRGLEIDRPRFATSEELRAIGSELDQVRAKTFSVTETPEGFELSAVLRDSSLKKTYSHSQLRAFSDTLRHGRRPAPSAETAT